MSETTGLIDFVYGGETFQTWYNVAGDLKSGVRPLIVLHGGPGLSHAYMSPHFALSASRPVILYDQLGIGKSTHLRDKPAAFWTVELFMAELDNVLAHFDIAGSFDVLGHSWGAMLATNYAAARRPAGLEKLVLVSGTPSIKLWEESMGQLLARWPAEFQEILKRHEREGTTDDPEYQKGMEAFFAKHVCTVAPWPQDLSTSFDAMKEDPTVSQTMLGQAEFNITGSLKTWSVVDELPQIACPTLLINGAEDEAQDVGVWPYFTGISKIKWVRFAESSHLAFFEEPERYFGIVGDFLADQ